MASDCSGSSRAIKATAKAGISFGSCLAMIISYTAWKSIPWAIFHGLLSWIYVIYYAISIESAQSRRG